MRTNRNFFSKITRATLIFALAFASIISVSCQNAAHHSFHYKPDFIKQMVYQVTNEFFTRNGFAAQNQINHKEAVVLVNYTIPVKNCCTVSTTNDNELTNGLIQAAQLNAPVAEAEVESDNMLEFLTQAAQLNAPVAEVEAEQDNTLEFLTNAAQLNTPVAEVEVEHDNTLEFLTNAAQLNTPVVQDSNANDETLDLLINAAQLNAPVANE